MYRERDKRTKTQRDGDSPKLPTGTIQFGRKRKTPPDYLLPSAIHPLYSSHRPMTVGNVPTGRHPTVASSRHHQQLNIYTSPASGSRDGSTTVDDVGRGGEEEEQSLAGFGPKFQEGSEGKQKRKKKPTKAVEQNEEAEEEEEEEEEAPTSNIYEKEEGIEKGEEAEGKAEYSGEMSIETEGQFHMYRFVQTKVQPDAKRCDLCQTGNTPEWRKGPNGASTLCNACGLKWRREDKERQKRIEEDNVRRKLAIANLLN